MPIGSPQLDPKLLLLTYVKDNIVLTADDDTTLLVYGTNYIVNTAWYQDRVMREPRHQEHVPLQITIGPVHSTKPKMINIGGRRRWHKVICPINVWARNSKSGTTPKITGKIIRWKATQQVINIIGKNQNYPRVVADETVIEYNSMWIVEYYDRDEPATRDPLLRTVIVVVLNWFEAINP